MGKLNAAGEEQIQIGGSVGAPTDASYITQTHDPTLSAEQALEDLATGLLKNTTGTGVLSIAAAADLPAHASGHEYGGADALSLNGAQITAGTVAAARLGTMTGDSGSGGASGAVPAPSAGDAAVDKILRASGSWDYPDFLQIGKVLVSGGSAPAYLEIASIPNWGTDLLVVWAGRGSASPGDLAAYLVFNTDTGGNYDYEITFSTATSTPISQVVTGGGNFSSGGTRGTTGSSTAIGGGVFSILNYAGATLHKYVEGRTSYHSNRWTISGAYRPSTPAAISNVRVYLGGSGWLDGSYAAVYIRK